jgi:hypothetical protein
MKRRGLESGDQTPRRAVQGFFVSLSAGRSQDGFSATSARFDVGSRRPGPPGGRGSSPGCPRFETTEAAGRSAYGLSPAATTNSGDLGRARNPNDGEARRRYPDRMERLLAENRDRPVLKVGLPPVPGAHQDFHGFILGFLIQPGRLAHGSATAMSKESTYDSFDFR